MIHSKTKERAHCICHAAKNLLGFLLTKSWSDTVAVGNSQPPKTDIANCRENDWCHVYEYTNVLLPSIMTYPSRNLRVPSALSYSEEPKEKIFPLTPSNTDSPLSLHFLPLELCQVEKGHLGHRATVLRKMGHEYQKRLNEKRPKLCHILLSSN